MCCGSDETVTPAADASYGERLTAAGQAEVVERVRSGRVLVRYVGPGFVLGAPARDLTADEWAGLTVGQQDAVALSGVYEFEVVEEEEVI